MHDARRPHAGKRIGTGLAILCWWCAVAPTGVCAEEPRYQVEVIVFERDTPDGPVAARSGDSSGLSAAPGVDPAAAGASMRPLNTGELQLAGIEARLRKSGYTPLVHTGWRQTGGEGRAARVTSPATGTDGSPLVNGSVKLAVGRQLGINADLLCQYNGQPVRLSGKRIVKFGELHYFDDSIFGLLVQVTRAGGGD